MVVDLTNLSVDEARLFESNQDRVLLDYKELTEDLLRKSSDLSWLINNVTSRNTNFSRILLYLRYERFLDDISQTHSIDEVKTDDFILANLLKRKYIVNYIGKPNKSKFGLKSIIYCIWWSINAFFCKSQSRLSLLKKTDGSTIIDTDIAKRTDKYNDRYYGDVLDKIDNIKTEKFFYNIIYLPFPKKRDIELIDRNTKYHTIYPWDFLNSIDYLHALRMMLKRNKKHLLDYIYLGINQRPVLEYVYRDNTLFYYYFAFLYERMIYRMSNMGIRIRLYLDWYENQSVDKSFYWAMYRYFPDVKTHSYIGFMADTKSNPITVPTNTEYELGIAPQKIFVCNKALYDQFIESGYKGQVEVAPFYRAENIWSIGNINERFSKFTVLVPLGLNDEEVRFKVQTLNHLMDSEDELEILLKPHPVYNCEIIKGLLGNANSIKIVGGNIYDYLPKVNAVVASNSTTTYESLALGKPLLYMVDPQMKLALNRPKNTPEDFWYEIRNKESFDNAIEKIKCLSEEYLKKTGNDLMDYYFTQNTKELTNKLFAL